MEVVPKMFTEDWWIYFAVNYKTSIILATVLIGVVVYITPWKCDDKAWEMIKSKVKGMLPWTKK